VNAEAVSQRLEITTCTHARASADREAAERPTEAGYVIARTGLARTADHIEPGRLAVMTNANLTPAWSVGGRFTPTIPA
jgi:hypothetical protein